MAIRVKYFGETGLDSFDREFESMEELMKQNPFKPFGKENKQGPTGKGFEFKKSNHSRLSNLKWEDSGHEGEAKKYAGWDEFGDPAVLDGGGVDGAVFGIDIAPTGVYVHGRKAILHSPGAGWVGAEWDVSAGQAFSAPDVSTTYYFGLDPEDENSCGITIDRSDFPITVRLYAVGIEGGAPVLKRVWNSGDVDIIAMWLKGPSE